MAWLTPFILLAGALNMYLQAQATATAAKKIQSKMDGPTADALISTAVPVAGLVLLLLLWKNKS